MPSRVGVMCTHTNRENRLIDAHPIIGFMAIMLAFIMGQPPLELVTALGPAPLSDPLSLPLLLRVRDSLTYRLCQLSDSNVTNRVMLGHADASCAMGLKEQAEQLLQLQVCLAICKKGRRKATDYQRHYLQEKVLQAMAK
jgi:hypothetical protein